MKEHSLFATLKSLRGNPRGCVYTEPLWGIPFNLYIPYVSVYMLALGLSDRQIGMIVSLSWGFQIFLALLSGVVTDKLGRRLTTVIFDILSWTVPALISAFAQNFWYFLVAGLINSFWRIPLNSWTCLLVEDADKSQLADIYTWIYIANIIVGFVSPLAGLFIATYSLISTMRALYVFAAIMFTLKAILTYLLTRETAQGVIRRQETRHLGVLDLLGGYKEVLRKFFRTPQTLYTAGIMVVLGITSTVSGSFWSIMVTEKLHIPARDLSIFPFIKSTFMLLFFFFVMPRISRMHFKTPLVLGFFGLILSQLVLVTSPVGSYIFLVLNVFLEAWCFAMVNPLMDRMVVLTIDPQERARIQSILYVGVILLTSPFGWIAGMLSEIHKGLPFILNMVLFAVGVILASLAGTASQRGIPEEAPAV